MLIYWIFYVYSRETQSQNKKKIQFPSKYNEIKSSWYHHARGHEEGMNNYEEMEE